MLTTGMAASPSINDPGFKMPLARSFLFHLLAPYAVHLLLGCLLVRYLSAGGVWVILVFGGIAVLAGIVVVIPFGVLHILQTIRLTPGWRSPWTQFLVGLLNPSRAILTIVGLFCFVPEVITVLWR